MRCIVICSLVVLTTLASAAEHLIATNVEIVDGDTLNVKPGDIVRIAAGDARKSDPARFARDR